MSPIFVRPVREQLEHDRLIRFLQAKYKRKHEVAMNLGEEQAAPIKIGATTFFPDLVLTAGRKLAGVVEVESAESVNNLEAMAQWVPFARARVPFHLYVPVQVYDAARRLCEANSVRATEIWSYRPASDGFDLVRMLHDAGAVAAATRRPTAGAAAPAARPKRPAAKAKKPRVRRAAKAARRGARPAKAGKAKR